jgi:cytoskeletal protein CcmA (bactofilin family)
MWARKEQHQQSTERFENFTLLAKDVDFKGGSTLMGLCELTVASKERSTTGTLIEESTQLRALFAGVLMNSGKINGTITAVEKIQILNPESGRRIRTPLIAIEEGSHFHGMRHGGPRVV